MRFGERLLIQSGLSKNRTWTEIAAMVNAKYGQSYTADELRQLYEKIPHLKDQFDRFRKMKM
jgi:hypothetical protein